ncbi:Glycogen synthase [Caloramator mitchellensis]|uniref:Glycogen synthase n=1 Tax=Caloramator mitchellensis TaxID=908809 RepID=A0A0R3K369_CALMK|nr:glycogen synthase GlgA [Caloramator mitchellensis]KRQ87378.1 Glycogen synthase [Caloramator mitchellensis]
MNILFATSESYPFLKTGGLADVAYALPRALRRLGIDARVIMPKYGDIKYEYSLMMKHIGHFNVQLGWRNQYCGVEYLEYDGIPFYFIDNEYYFKRGGAYGYSDDDERFVFFSRAVVEAINYIDFIPDVIHCNDWHTGAVPLLLKSTYSNSPNHKDIKSIFTIHNLRYQGVFDKKILWDLLGLDDYYYTDDRLKYYDGVSLMKAGIIYSDKVTTVSNTYAEEIKTPFYGEGLQGLLSAHSYKLLGIVNGIDYEVYNPLTDKYIYRNYDANNIEAKKENKMALQRELNLPVNPDIPMIGMVTRLTKQKGLDLIAQVMQEILEMDVQFVLLGTGDYIYEEAFKYFSRVFPSKISSNIRFSEELSRRIYASSDLFLMPSLFEPCGIGQLLALRYGSLPIVRETGGLKDTVKPYNEYTGEGNGFSFANYNAYEMLNIIRYAVTVYYNQKDAFDNLVVNAMKSDNSWDESAKLYIELYNSIGGTV